MDQNNINQPSLPHPNQGGFPSFYPQPILLHAQNQLYLAYPIDNLNMLNGSGMPQSIQGTIVQPQNLWNIPHEPFVKEQFIQHQYMPDNQQNKEKIPQIERQAPKTNHKVRYFDTNTAPLMTSQKYYKVDEVVEKKTLTKEEGELNFPEEDSNQFILFKNRRIKKKFKCFMSEQDQRIFNMHFANESGQEEQGIQGLEQGMQENNKNSQEDLDEQNMWNSQRLRNRRKTRKSKHIPSLESSNDQKDPDQSFKCEEI